MLDIKQEYKLKYSNKSQMKEGIDFNDKGGLFYTAAPGSGKYGDYAYGKQFAPAEVSKEARDDAKAGELWELSDKLLGASSSA